MVDEISIKELMSNKYQVIDTRSEIEFAKDHIPGALNIPILNTSERHDVGVMYAKDQKKAIEKGYSIYHDKIGLLEAQLATFSKSIPVVVYCFRGGMRSDTFAKLVESLGFKTKRIKGGYKEYRAFIQSYFDNYSPNCKFIVLHGLAGVGKTDILQYVPSIDLEGLASHRSSLFGSIGLTHRSQKMFESLLYKRLQEIKDEVLFLEGESKKLGHIYIPDKIFECIENATPVMITSPIALRVKRIVHDYFTHGEDEKICEIIISLKPYIGKKLTEQLIAYIHEKEYACVAKILLVDYYDEKYEHLFNNFKFSLTLENIENEKTAQQLKSFFKIPL